jgi:hypothetical protein
MAAGIKIGEQILNGAANLLEELPPPHHHQPPRDRLGSPSTASD